MAVFISLVGLQPGAVAGPLKSVINKGKVSVSRCVLFSTEKVQNIATRLQDWCKEEMGVACDVIRIEDGPSGDLCNKVLEVLETEASEEILFNGTPAGKAQAVTLAGILPDKTDLLYSAADGLYHQYGDVREETWKKYDLADLGFDSLLKLNDLTATNGTITSPMLNGFLTETRICVPKQIYQGVTISGGAKTVPFDLAFESNGYLYGLRAIDGEGPEEIMQAARDAMRLDLDLNGLIPELTGFCKTEASINRLREANKDVMDSRKKSTCSKQLKDWIKGKVSVPGNIVETSGMSSLISLGKQQGAGGEGPLLAVCLGKDPSATLVSLYTHKPRKVWIFYDENTPEVVEKARLMALNARNFPIGQLFWSPTDLLGRGIIKKICADKSKIKGKTFRIDITPGTKAQGYPMARIPKFIGTAELWSLVAHKDQAMSLTGKECIRLQSPGIPIQAEIMGGKLVKKGTFVGSEDDFLTIFTLFIHEYAVKKKRKNVRLPRLIDECNARAFNTKEGNLCVEKRGEGANFKVCWHQVEKTGSIEKIKDGFWFEQVVGNAFFLSGADEVILGMKWDWPRDFQRYLEQTLPEGSDIFKDELDVAVRYGNRYLAISCKTGFGSDRETRPEKEDVARREIEAVALKGFGYRTIPVLARAGVFPDRKEKPIPLKGVVPLDLDLIAFPDKLKKWVDDVFAARTTNRPKTPIAGTTK